MSFLDTMSQIKALLEKEGIQNYSFMALDPGTREATGGHMIAATSAENVSTLFHSAIPAFFPLFARHNGMPAAVTANAMCGFVELALTDYEERIALARASNGSTVAES